MCCVAAAAPQCLARLAILGFYAPGNPPPMPLVEFKHSEYNPQAKDYWLQHPNGLPASPSVQVVTGRQVQRQNGLCGCPDWRLWPAAH